MDELDEIRARKIECYWNDLKAPSVTLERKAPKGPVTLTDSNFEDTICENDFVIVDCWAPWCGPCRMLSPIIDELASDYEGKVLFGKLNTDENRGIASHFRIMSIPTILFFRNGKLVDTVIGAVPRHELESRIRRYV